MAAVLGQPDPYHGEVVRACVVFHEGQHASAEALIAHCRQGLAPYKVPATIDVRRELPLTAVGKVLYRVLREELASSGSPA